MCLCGKIFAEIRRGFRRDSKRFFLERGLNGLNGLPQILYLKLVRCGENFSNIRIFFVFFVINLCVFLW